jgi:hypothetical protein
MKELNYFYRTGKKNRNEIRLDLDFKTEKNMTYTCRPFYSMQKILACGNCKNFHRKFGKLTEGKRGVYIWGFANEDFEIPVNCDPNNASMEQFEVQVSSESIGIYYVGKVESHSSNIFERIMQERANLFGGFSPIFKWDHYFKATPFLSVWQQLNDTSARKKISKKHFKRLENYTNCDHQGKLFNIENPILHSNAHFHENNLIDRILNPNSEEDQELKQSISQMSKNFIFTWIEIRDQELIEPIEHMLHRTLGLNTLGTGKIKILDCFAEIEVIDSVLSCDKLNNKKLGIDFSNNIKLLERMQQLNSSSKDLINNCNCFKG